MVKIVLYFVFETVVNKYIFLLQSNIFDMFQIIMNNNKLIITNLLTGNDIINKWNTIDEDTKLAYGLNIESKKKSPNMNGSKIKILSIRLF